MPGASGSESSYLLIELNQGNVVMYGDVISGTATAYGPHSGSDLITVTFPDGSTTSNTAAVWFSYKTTGADAGKEVTISAMSGYGGSVSVKVTVVSVTLNSFAVTGGNTNFDLTTGLYHVLVNMSAAVKVSPASAFENTSTALVEFRMVQYLDYYDNVTYVNPNASIPDHERGVDSTKGSPNGELTLSVTAAGNGNAIVNANDRPHIQFNAAQVQALETVSRNSLFNDYIQVRGRNGLGGAWNTIGYAQWHLVDSLKNSTPSGGVSDARGIPTTEEPQAPTNPQRP